MISLLIDTAYSDIIVAIKKNDIVLYHNVEKNDNHLSERLLPMIDEAFLSINESISTIDNIMVVNGPGSFTGVRIGVTVAKTLAYTMNKKISIISKLEAMTFTKSNKKFIASIIDARRGYVYAGLYDSDKLSIIKDSYILFTSFLLEIEKYANIDDVDFLSYDDFENIVTHKPIIDVDRLIGMHINDNGINPHMINPNYLKKTEAEEKLENK